MNWQKKRKTGRRVDSRWLIASHKTKDMYDVISIWFAFEFHSSRHDAIECVNFAFRFLAKTQPGIQHSCYRILLVITCGSCAGNMKYLHALNVILSFDPNKAWPDRLSYVSSQRPGFDFRFVVYRSCRGALAQTQLRTMAAKHFQFQIFRVEAESVKFPFANPIRRFFLP